jgi:hypothetical protein|tara:strand:+ start:40 stop:399 length:360 start_codon:yes stop_codon:yes gene_type:complete
MSQVTLTKNNLERRSYTQVINTEFSQLTTPESSLPTVEIITVEEFFQNYNEIFFLIPKTGENSHTTLITTSTDYIGYQPFSDELIALQEEITGLRTELLNAQKQLQNNISKDIQTVNNG